MENFMACLSKLSLRQNKIKFYKITLLMNTIMQLNQSSEKITIRKSATLYFVFVAN